MTPLQFAKEQCANFENGGGCAGIGIKDDGRLYMFGKKAECLLAKREPCRYFEECALPMRFDDPSAKGLIRAEQHQEAVNLYAAMVNGTKKSKYPICPHCQKREIEPPKRFCYQCAIDRKKAADLKAQRKLRHVRKTVQQTPINIGPNEGGFNAPDAA